MNHLLWDARKVIQIKNRWRENPYHGLHLRFLTSSSGLGIVFPSRPDENYQWQRDPLKNNVYKRASRGSGFIFSLSQENREKVMVAGKISIQDSYVVAGEILFLLIVELRILIISYIYIYYYNISYLYNYLASAFCYFLLFSSNWSRTRTTYNSKNF